MDNDTGEDGISGTGVAYAIRLPIGFAAGTELTADSTLEDTTKVNVQIPDLKKEKKESIFHTVQKGETLFSISKKYNTSVEALKKLNNLPANAAIFPGNNILVK